MRPRTWLVTAAMGCLLCGGTAGAVASQATTSTGQQPAEAAAESAAGDVQLPLTGVPLDPDTWALTADCASCHEKQAESMTDEGLLAATHGNTDNGCADCHHDAALAALHGETVAADDQETDEAASEAQDADAYANRDMCLTCHGSYEDLAELTQDSTALKKPDGTYENPHATHLGNVNCSTCHSIHKSNDKWLIKGCYSCHHTRKLGCGSGVGADCHAAPAAPDPVE